jgi:peptide/nickel transport system permease protein
MPGNPLELIAGEGVGLLTPEQRAAVAASVGLDQPLPAQYLRYLGNTLRGDLGYSFQQHQPIAALLADRLPWTLLLTGTGLLLSTLVGAGAGALAAWRRGGRGDLGLVTLFITLESLPTFWVGMVLIALLAVRWPLFPAFGAQTPWLMLSDWQRALDILHHLALPLATLTIVSIPGFFLVTRAAMLAVLGEDYIVVARAKGLRERRVLLGHALRNALLPVVTAFTLSLAFAFGGATVVETVFSYPGVGRLIYEAVLRRDYPVLQAAFLMITVLVVAANLATDLLYPLLDPRIRSARPSARAGP